MTTLFFRIMEFSCYGVFWVTALFLASAWFGKKRGVLWQYIVSVCIAIHLLVPVHIQWASVNLPVWQLSGQNLTDEDILPNVLHDGQAVGETKKNVEGKEQREDLLRGVSGDVSPEKTVDRQGERKQEVSGTETGNGASVRQKDQGNVLSPLFLAETIWIFGMLVFFGGTAISYIAFCKQARRWSLPAKSLAGQVLEEVKAQYRIRRKILLRRNNRVHSPVLYGVIRPVILLPDQEYSRQEYRYIFCHELSHYRRGDVLMKYLFTLCRGVYWFHPLVWWMCRRACAQMELLCDEAVVAGRDVEEKRAYSMVILRHMTESGLLDRIPLTTSFYGGKGYMKMRFKNIMNTKKKTGATAVLAAVLVALILGGVKWSHAAGAKKNTADRGPAVKKTEDFQEEINSRNILVVGTDLNGTDRSERGVADAIMLVRVNAGTGMVQVQNIPRDLLVDFAEIDTESEEFTDKEQKAVAGWGKMKLGLAYALYGYDALETATEYLCNVEVDSHIILNYESLPAIIDAAGGVEVSLTKQEADYLNSTNYIAKRENRTLKSGSQMLNGDQATGYLRIRKAEAGSPIVDGELSEEKDIFGRAQRCRNVIAGLEKQVRGRQMDWTDLIPSMLQEKGAEVDVDLSAKELVLLVHKVMNGDLYFAFSGLESSDQYAVGHSKENGTYLTPKGDEKEKMGTLKELIESEATHASTSIAD